MKQLKVLVIVTACALAMSGCNSTQTASIYTSGPQISMIAANEPIALATLEPTPGTQSDSQTRTFRLGAGDALGQAIYANYATIARANAGWQYASGSTLEE